MNLAEARWLASLAVQNGERLGGLQCEYEYNDEGEVSTILIMHGESGGIRNSLLVSETFSFQDDEWIEEYDDYMTFTTVVYKVGPATYFVRQTSDATSVRLLITLA